MMYSVDRMPGKTTNAAERKLPNILATKWDQQYSDVVACDRTRMDLAVIFSNTLLLHTDQA